MNKTKIVMICRKLQSLHKGCYNFKNSFYKNTFEVMDDINVIIPYGDITSVRKTCVLLNDFYKRETNKDLKCLVSPDTQSILDNKKKVKDLSIPTFQKRTGNFIIYF
tara:strand:- start:1391 stop:1711 length:321 start_codon:yes stop_codon:yes gene_type:complete